MKREGSVIYAFSDQCADSWEKKEDEQSHMKQMTEVVLLPPCIQIIPLSSHPLSKVMFQPPSHLPETF